MINNRSKSLDTSKLSRSSSNDILGVGDASLKHDNMDIDATFKQGGLCSLFIKQDRLVPSSTLMDAKGSRLDLDNSKCIISGCEGTSVDAIKGGTFEGKNEEEGVRMSIATNVFDPNNRKDMSIDIDIDINVNDDSKSEIFSQSSLSSSQSPTVVHSSSFVPSLGLSSFGLGSSINSAKSGLGEEGGGGGGGGRADSARNADLNVNRHLNIRAYALPSFSGR